MTSPLYQTTPVELPGTVTSDFNGGVQSTAQAPMVLEGHGDPTHVVTAPAGSFFTDVDSNTVYANSTGTNTGWHAISATSPLTTKGDIFVHGAADTRLPVGSNGQILSANSGQATGLLWEAAPDLAPYITTADAVAEFFPKVHAPIRATVADGDTFNFSAETFYMLHLAADAATFTININKPADGVITRFCFDHAIAAVTWNHAGVAGGYTGGIPAAITADMTFAFIYDAIGDKYWPWPG